MRNWITRLPPFGWAAPTVVTPLVGAKLIRWLRPENAACLDCEVRVVEDVQELRLDIQANMLPDGEVLGDREVRIHELRAGEINGLAELTCRVGRGDRRLGRIVWVEQCGVQQQQRSAGAGLPVVTRALLLQRVHVDAIQDDARIARAAGAEPVDIHSVGTAQEPVVASRSPSENRRDDPPAQGLLCEPVVTLVGDGVDSVRLEGVAQVRGRWSIVQLLIAQGGEVRGSEIGRSVAVSEGVAGGVVRYQPSARTDWMLLYSASGGQEAKTPGRL